MKVIKAPNTQWSFKHTCDNCTAELEVEIDDVKFQHHSANDPRGLDSDWDSWTAKCPLCSEHFSIPGDSIPKAVQVEIKRLTNSRDNGPYGGGGYYDR